MPAEAKLYYKYEYDAKIDAYVIYRIIKTATGEFKYVYGYVYGETNIEKAIELVDALNK